jgi:hypothetical protein
MRIGPKNAKTPWAEAAQEVTGEHYVLAVT